MQAKNHCFSKSLIKMFPWKTTKAMKQALGVWWTLKCPMFLWFLILNSVVKSFKTLDSLALYKIKLKSQTPLKNEQSRRQSLWIGATKFEPTLRAHLFIRRRLENVNLRSNKKKGTRQSRHSECAPQNQHQLYMSFSPARCRSIGLYKQCWI